MTSPVDYRLEGDIGVITVDNPPVNALSQAVRQGLLDAVIAAQTDASKALLVICDGRTFIAGADITEFGKGPLEPYLPDLLDTIEASAKPVIAALHGTALASRSPSHRCPLMLTGLCSRESSRTSLRTL